MARTWARFIICLMAFIGAALGVGTIAQTPANNSTSKEPVKLTNQEDRQRMMDQLKITMFPSGPGAYLASTYDENTANRYPNLPDPLTFNNGSKVTAAAQ